MGVRSSIAESSTDLRVLDPACRPVCAVFDSLGQLGIHRLKTLSENDFSPQTPALQTPGMEPGVRVPGSRLRRRH